MKAIKTIKTIACMLLSGLGVGWLIGLSVSPVLHIVVASVIALIVGVTGALMGLSNIGDVKESLLKKISEANPLPVTLLVIGLGLGASFGVLSRTHNWLGKNSSDIIQEWQRNGLDSLKIATQIFDNLYPPSCAKMNTPQTSINPSFKVNDDVLYQFEINDCSFIAGNHGENLRTKLKLTLNSEKSSRFLDTLDSLSLEAFKEMICPEK